MCDVIIKVKYMEKNVDFNSCMGKFFTIISTDVTSEIVEVSFATVKDFYNFTF